MNSMSKGAGSPRQRTRARAGTTGRRPLVTVDMEHLRKGKKVAEAGGAARGIPVAQGQSSAPGWCGSRPNRPGTWPDSPCIRVSSSSGRFAPRWRCRKLTDGDDAAWAKSDTNRDSKSGDGVVMAIVVWVALLDGLMGQEKGREGEAAGAAQEGRVTTNDGAGSKASP
ncbi:hypothetical protein NL676_039895 [Syzygium grande]|nr:hypothetical protein NL676_039895 [Syzygium grande]